MAIVYTAAQKGSYEIWTSTLSMIECRRLGKEEIIKKPLDENNDKIISGIFRQPFIKPIPMAMDIAENARAIWRATIGLSKYQDAVHIASAIK